MSKSKSENLPENLSALTNDDFRIFIGKKASEKSKSIFKNGSPENANLVAANIFKHSTRVRIYAENMDGKIGDSLPDYYEEATKFLSKPDSVLTIVLDRVEEKKSKAFEYFLAFKKDHSTKLKIYKASDQFVKSIKKYQVDGHNDLHFMTGDINKFRLEYDINSKSAYFSFNNLDITKPLTTEFDANLSSCEVV